LSTTLIVPEHETDLDSESVADPSSNGQTRRRATAETMAAKQRDISVSEFFAKNRHLLGFDNPRKALLTAVKEAVDNSLDACEEAGILPEIWVHIEQTGDNRFKLGVQDNGPGIVKKQIPLIFGKLLYGSKFHRLRMSRGQQGIGISAAGMYGMLTTGKPVKIISKISLRKPAHYYEIQIDTKKNTRRSSTAKAKASISRPTRPAGLTSSGTASSGSTSTRRKTAALPRPSRAGRGSPSRWRPSTSADAAAWTITWSRR
jgi:DNA topoisomerase VI subunit B